MKAPEKIYVQLPSRNWIGRTWNETPLKEADKPIWKNATNIEYTRTDAFIEKTWSWIEDNMLSSNQQDKSRFYYEQFINYMKGEQYDRQRENNQGIKRST